MKYFNQIGTIAGKGLSSIVTGLIVYLLTLCWSGHIQALETRSFKLASAPLQVDVNSSVGWTFSFNHAQLLQGIRSTFL